MLPPHPRTAQENCRILQQLVELRAQKSALLGFETHAAFVLEMNMAKDCKTVADFLGEARESLARAAGGQRGAVSRDTGGGRQRGTLPASASSGCSGIEDSVLQGCLELLPQENSGGRVCWGGE